MWWFTAFVYLFASLFRNWNGGECCFHESNSLIILKPDILKRNLQEEALKELSYLNITCLGKFIWTKELAVEFYQDHQGKSFFLELIESLVEKDSYFLTTQSSIEISRSLILHLRKRYAVDTTCNSFHGADSTESFHRELNLILKNSESIVSGVAIRQPLT